MSALLGIPVGAEGSGRDRYGRAMALFVAGQISGDQLEAYRVAAAHDRLNPDLFLVNRTLPAPQAPPDGDHR